MKIKELDLYAVGTRRENGTLTPHIVVKLTSDDGTVGIGEMSDLGHNPVMPDVPLMEERLRKALIGVDPFDPPAVDPIVDQYQAPLGAGLDIAVHDLRARSLGVPVHDLYGGAHRNRHVQSQGFLRRGHRALWRQPHDAPRQLLPARCR